MKLSTFLVIVSIVAFIFGILFIFIPGALLSLYGISLNAGGQLVARLFGAALLGYSVLTWSARKRCVFSKGISVPSSVIPNHKDTKNTKVLSFFCSLCHCG